MLLSRDFRLWLYRDRCKLTWAQLGEQPAWRTERDLFYLSLEGLAQAWHAAEARKVARKQEQDAAFEAVKQRGRQALGLVK